MFTLYCLGALNSKMAVAELKRPTKDKTFWVLLIWMVPPAIIEGYEHPVVINFNLLHRPGVEDSNWVKYPDDPYQVYWDYNQGAQLRILPHKRERRKTVMQRLF
jgi:hypothetical protein